MLNRAEYPLPLVPYETKDLFPGQNQLTAKGSFQFTNEAFIRENYIQFTPFQSKHLRSKLNQVKIMKNKQGLRYVNEEIHFPSSKNCCCYCDCRNDVTYYDSENREFCFLHQDVNRDR
jgi:hypothetical protein